MFTYYDFYNMADTSAIPEVFANQAKTFHCQWLPLESCTASDQNFRCNLFCAHHLCDIDLSSGLKNEEKIYEFAKLHCENQNASRIKFKYLHGNALI